MPRRTIELAFGHHYHVYNRGNNRQRIFIKRENYVHFLRVLREHFAEKVAVVAYCLMPNHYHLLVRLDSDDFSRIMHSFSTAYAKAINKQHERVGALFQGPFKASLVDEDEYLMHLSRYIHLNPVRAGLVSNAADWEFSSYRDYLRLRSGTLPQSGIVLSQFGNVEDYESFVREYQEAEREKIEHLLFK
ncbi:MAG: transposase [Gemmataceae bacterium]